MRRICRYFEPEADADLIGLLGYTRASILSTPI